MRISYIIPTRNRADRLAETLAAIEALGEHDAEIVVVDNASERRPELPEQLGSGVRVRRVDLDENIGAAARNVGVREADPASTWVVMLDDDSHPTGLGFLDALATQPRDVAAVMADIYLPKEQRREDGGLPEVFVGCGVALRRDAFLDTGGYDEGFGYYAEEYDLSARLLMADWRIVFEPRFRVDHHKDPGGRDFGAIVARLVRNNGWVARRYSPAMYLDADLAEVKNRYRSIAEANRVVGPYEKGLAELERTVADQPRTPMDEQTYERFTGLAAARDAIGYVHAALRFKRVNLWKPGKNAWVVRRVLAEMGVEEVKSRPQATIIGTMSPGPMLDAAERLGPHGFMPWRAGFEALAISERAKERELAERATRRSA